MFRLSKRRCGNLLQEYDILNKIQQCNINRQCGIQLGALDLQPQTLEEFCLYALTTEPDALVKTLLNPKNIDRFNSDIQTYVNPDQT